ncbi:hypothetical protein [Streptomyces zaomyceticus]|uniref:hypothetical protein n=1 Tax=Streptomyces zaomyceticus TaxID=68286 RepID=UPI002E11047D|nr:hypothetical protein OG237_15840 [Streptomyces zaomyceticus]
MSHPNTPQPDPNPAPPSKKGPGAGKITAIVGGSIFGALLLLGIIGALVGEDPDTTAGDKHPSSSPTASSSSPTPPPTATTPTTTAPTQNPATTTAPAPSRTTDTPDSSIPPKPEAAARQAYLDALNAIDPRIIKPSKEDQAVSRGLNQCSSIRTIDEPAKLSALALDRFTITSRLPDIATPETGDAIVKAVRAHLCPDF